MPADAKEILDDAVDRREALEVRDRCEAAHLALAVAGRLMRHFDAIVRVLGCAVQDRRDRRENVAFLGPPDVGQTNLAISLAIVESGRRVYYGTLAGLIAVADRRHSANDGLEML